MKLIRARLVEEQTVRYEAADGELVDYVGGTWAWRNNNPGNIIMAPFAKKNGAIGDAGGFAIFPDYETGLAALKELLFLKKYQEKSIAEVIQAYAPLKDGNNPEQYRKLVKKFTGINSSRKIKELNAEELDQVISAII